METNRRRFLATTASALTTSIFTGNVKGANDRVGVGFIGTGVMGQGNMASSMLEPEVDVVALCDVYQANLDQAHERVEAAGHKPKTYHDFRDLLADRSVDAVCIATPDHWHALMTVEACKAGKDVYVEKPVCTYVNEAPKMIEAARKYKRVVQVGTQSRSAGHMEEIRQIVQTGQLGKVTAVSLGNITHEPPEGIGNPPDSDPPKGLDWNFWLGPAPFHAYNRNRFHVTNGLWSGFRYYWDYGGGELTDNGIHIIDLVHMAFNEPVPSVMIALGQKNYLKDSRETPDTTTALFQYPEFLMTYQHRYGNDFDWPGTQIMMFGSEATLCFGRPAYYALYRQGKPRVFGGRITPWVPGEAFGAGFMNPRPLPPKRLTGKQEEPSWYRNYKIPPTLPATVEKKFEPTESHWANLLRCMRTREKPIADIELGARSTVTALMGNVSMRAGIRAEFDFNTWTSPQKEAQRFVEYHYRSPWKLEV